MSKATLGGAPPRGGGSNPRTTEPTLKHKVRTLGRALAWIAAVAVMVATLLPSRAEVDGTFFDCIVCGDRGLADAIVNVALFLPFGVALAMGTRSWRRALLYAVVLSAGVELAQHAIPGRHPSGGDLLFNSFGAALGVLLIRSPRMWLHSQPVVAARWSFFSAIMLLAIVAATGWLFSPALPRSTYFVRWTPTLPHLEHYDGQVSASALGDRAYPPGMVDDSRTFQRLLEQGEELRIRAITGSRPPGLASLFSVYDERHREVLLVGPDRGDFVLRLRSHARRLRLDHADLRASLGPRDSAPNIPLDVRIRLGKGAHCMAVNDHESCSYGFTAARGWAALFYAESFPRWVRGVLDSLWLAMLCFPIGWWARRRPETMVALVTAEAALLVVPPFVLLLPTAPPGMAGALTGISGGFLAGRLTHRKAEIAGATGALPARQGVLPSR